MKMDKFLSYFVLLTIKFLNNRRGLKKHLGALHHLVWPWQEHFQSSDDQLFLNSYLILVTHIYTTKYRSLCVIYTGYFLYFHKGSNFKFTRKDHQEKRAEEGGIFFRYKVNICIASS